MGRVFIFALVLGACAHATISSPPSVPSPGAGAAMDSVDARRVERGARSAQQRFESIRWSTLEFGWSRAVEYCHERIGRYCLWYSDNESSWETPEENARLSSERERLVEWLRTTVSVSPRDAWARGQLVRYLIEKGETAEAIAISRECAEDQWWCAALSGYTLHTAGRFVDAEREFDRALAAMPARERRRWTELTPLLAGRDASAYRRLNDAQRDSVERRFWWLANPLYMVPGNERLTEHLSRNVIERIYGESRRLDQVSWGTDNREIVLRFGAPRGWQRLRPAGGDPLAGRAIVTHYESHGREFSPSFEMMAAPEAIVTDGWKVKVPRARTQYRPGYATYFADLASQVAVFRRGDSALVVAAYELPADSVAASEPVRAAIVRATHERAPPRIFEARQTGRHGVIHAMMPAPDALISVEVLTAESGRAARSRHGLRSADIVRRGGGFGISDVLLLEPGGTPPESLDGALRRVRGSLRASAETPVMLFWELYDVIEDGEDITFAISLREQRERGFVARTLGIGRSAAAVDMRWREYVRGPVAPRGVEIRLGDLPPGTYSLEVIASRRGEGRARAVRTIAISR